MRPVLLLASALWCGCAVLLDDPGPVASAPGSTGARPAIDLAGSWALHLDTAAAATERPGRFETTATLPGSLDENGRGWANRDTTDQHLNRRFTYVGPAWYQRAVDVPDEWAGRRIELVMERTKVTHVWVDGAYAGTQSALYSPQTYDLTEWLTPGPHTLTVAVDNDPALVPVPGSHAYSEDTQTNWNGVLGAFRLEASDRSRVGALRVSPDAAARRARVEVRLQHTGPSREVRLHLVARPDGAASAGSVPTAERVLDLALARDTLVEATLDLGPDARLWSEFETPLYRLDATLTEGGDARDARASTFGLRDFRTRGTQFTVNGLPTMLRGRHDAAVFPLTGYPPTDVEAWTRYFETVRAYGLNHVRFHTWTPPEAAFTAADRAGVYLQPELPIWWGYKADDPAQRAFMVREGERILDAYGDHPSFVMFALGNEIGQDRDSLRSLVDHFRAYDPRPLYAQGSNNRFWDPALADGDDYWTTFRTAGERPDLRSDVRLSASFVDSREGGVLNTVYPGAAWTYTAAIAGVPVPVVGHEVGQYQVYPDYRGLDRYTGVLRPWNLERFRDCLADRGMLDQADAFARASGALAVTGYRAEIEAALRTPGYGGFQLLDLQDYPGQGTALVGLLDAFMESKGLVTPEAFRTFNDAVVVLATLERYVWARGEPVRATVHAANYGPTALPAAPVRWRLEGGGQTRAEGALDPRAAPQGALTALGDVAFEMPDGDGAEALTLHLAWGDRATSYPLWAFPRDVSTDAPAGVTVARRFDAATREALDRGGRVLLFPDSADVRAQSVGGQFIPEFWNYAMFTSIARNNNGRLSHGTMGLLVDTTHAALRDFPTAFHSDWQWWPVVKNSRPLILDGAPPELRPVVQAIDNLSRAHRLGLVFEARVGGGRLLVSMADLPRTPGPEARQLYASLLRYAASDRFEPAAALTPEAVRALLYGP